MTATATRPAARVPAGLDAKSLTLLAVALLLIATGALAIVRALGGDDTTRLTLYFDRALGVHEGSDLKVLGVTVGQVDSVTPEAGQVRLEVTVRGGVAVPADARAVSVTPSLVSGRYIQLTPAYTGGPQLTDGDVIPIERTAAPLEIDELYASLTELGDALGPDGANAEGSLSRLLDTGAANLDGQGEALGGTLENFGTAAGTLADSSGDFFGTVENLQSFVAMLNDNDAGVREVQNQLADVAGFLADDRDDLAGALTELGGALGQVETFIADNRERLAANVDGLAGVTASLVAQRESLAELLDTAPLAANNTLGAYNPDSGTFDGRANLEEIRAALLPLGASDHYRTGAAR